MTHNDIITKFKIEYDKADVTSSYPSLTEYEIATILDKAYLALISQKVTGVNSRKAGFEADLKSIEDLKQLVKTTTLSSRYDTDVTNVKKYSVAGVTDYLYFVDLFFKYLAQSDRDYVGPVKLVNHAIAQKFFWTDYNLPWVKIPVVYLENSDIFVVHDIDKTLPSSVLLTYIKQPKMFCADGHTVDLSSTFELNDSVAEELISLAISYALENVESPRLNAHLGMRGLES